MTTATLDDTLRELFVQLPEMTPELHKAAVYALENPNDVGVSSIRELAGLAAVKPNTLVRLSRACGYSGYDEFRAPFREELRRGGLSFPDRARWLQSLAQNSRLDGLYAAMADSAMHNLQRTFAATGAPDIKVAADAIIGARHTFVLGVGINHTLARQFAYLADMALDNVHAIPRAGQLATDDIARAGPEDVLLVMTFKPYRAEVLSAVKLARARGVQVIGISDSPASPVVMGSPIRFVVQTQTPQFFTSTLATSALLETLMAFVIAEADPDVVDKIEQFHARRTELGVYVDDEDA
ncbi:MAG: MurR/RpiR family transcriptional regulator [Pseudomonadota bacterium]